MNENISEAKYNLIYKCNTSSLYHKKRERFLSLCDKVSKIISLVFSTAYFSYVLTESQRMSFGVIVSVALISSLVFNLPDKAKQHADIATKYILLLSRIESIPVKKLTDEEICSFKMEILEIEATEPTNMNILVRICQNQIAEVEEQPDRVFEIPWYMRLTAQIINWQPKLDPSSKK